MGGTAASFDLAQSPRLFVVPADRLLPPVCPHCGSPGVHAQALTQALAQTQVQPKTTELALQVYLCDACAEKLARRQTIRIAWTLASALLGTSLGAALSFFFGQRSEAGQLILVVGITSLLCWFSYRYSATTHIFPQEIPWPHEFLDHPLLVSGARLIHCPDSVFSLTLHEHKFESLQPTLPVLTTTLVGSGVVSWRDTFLWLSPLFLSALWWCGLHAMGQATVRVVNMGPDSLIVMIDERRLGTLAAMRFEAPQNGQASRVLGGLRRIALLTQGGETLYQGTVTLLPGETLLLSRLLPQSCIYSETRNYSEQVSGSRLTPLGRGTSALVLKHRVDSWFMPLLNAPSTRGSDELSWTRVEGTREAIRLLPCP